VNPALVVILGVLAGIGTGILADWHVSRLCARDIKRREQVERRARLQRTIASLELGMCAIHGHKYLWTQLSQDMQVWRCGACGDLREYNPLSSYDQEKDGVA